MNVIEIAGLDPAYRLYQTDGGRYVRVGIEIEVEFADGSNTRNCALKAESADENGNFTGQKLPTFFETQVLTETEMPVFSEQASLPASGLDDELVSVAGVLYEWDETAWVDRGPIQPGASAGLAEALALFDATARELVIEAERAFSRMDSDAEIMTLLGQDLEDPLGEEPIP